MKSNYNRLKKASEDGTVLFALFCGAIFILFFYPPSKVSEVKVDSSDKPVQVEIRGGIVDSSDKPVQVEIRNGTGWSQYTPTHVKIGDPVQFYEISNPNAGPVESRYGYHDEWEYVTLLRYRVNDKPVYLWKSPVDGGTLYASSSGSLVFVPTPPAKLKADGGK